ncbi:hypothetical protein [Hyalangium gracile]|uniref:hypothetical protein n=1 Tax=Hyalangium gracile TaxID=394092 RepID=UPI001CC9D692|nr:hypothetical protein [Hyalangium gracile]
MAKLPKPVLFTKHFNVKPNIWAPLGLFEPSLNVDTPLFIDPLLLAASSNPTISKDAKEAYEQRFKLVIKFLHESKSMGDTYWKTATNLLRFPEIRGTCLGYGAVSTAGSAFGRKKTAQLLETAKAIVNLGVTDPDLFVAMSLFEKEIGPDLISDMTTNVIMPALVKLNEGVAKTLGIPTKEMKVGSSKGNLIPNPYDPDSPIILVPQDILRALPIAKDWDGIQHAIAISEALRSNVNKKVAALWADAVRQKDKDKLREEMLASKANFEAYLASIHSIPKVGYDVHSDPDGLLFWKRGIEELTAREPLAIEKPKVHDAKSMKTVVDKIIDQFTHLIENRDLWRELWHHRKRRPEKAAQRMFFAIALAYCEANDLDINPETETGQGAVDFKFSKGSTLRHLVEIKLSSNVKLVQGYTKQLELYKKGEKTLSATYVVLEVGDEGKKIETLDNIRARAIQEKQPSSEIVYINGMPKRSASKA